MVLSQLIRVNGIDVSSVRMNSKIEYLYQEKIDMTEIVFRFDVNNFITFDQFQLVEIWESDGTGTLEQDSNRKFSGNISKIERDVGTVKVTAFSFLWRAIQSEANQTFDVNTDTEAGEGSEIFITLAGLANITADSSSVVATGTGVGSIVLDKFVCNRAEVFERMQTLADIYAYQFFEDHENLKANFQPLGFEGNTNILYAGSDNNNLRGFPKWKEDSTKIFNKVEIIGAYQEVRQVETFNGDNSTTEFALEFAPEITEVTVDGVLQIGGVSGSIATFDYTVDQTGKKIIFESGSIPGVGVDNISVDYSYRAPRPVIKENESSISTLGRIIKNRFTFSDIQSVDDAERRADNLLSIYSVPFVSTKVKLDPDLAETFNLKVGQSIRVIDNRQNFDLTLVIKKLTRFYPASDVDLELGDKEIRISSFEWDNSLRLKRLEEEFSRAGDIVRVVKDPKHTLIVDRRDLRVSTQQYDQAAAFSILGLGSDAGYFDLGAGKMGTRDDAFEPIVEDAVTQGNGIYDEDFNDIDYFDSSSSTGDWLTGVITSGQTLRSSSIEKGGNNITTATPTFTGSGAGTPTFFLSADGTNWEVVTNGIKIFFANTGNDLRFRVDSSGGTYTLTDVNISSYR